MANGQGDGNQSSVINPSEIGRRDFLTAVSAIAVVAPASWAVAQPKKDMYGEIGKLIAAPGKREEVIANILEAIKDMPGCLSYVVAKDANDANGIWIFEAWDSKASHEASLSLPSVKAAIAKNLPLITGFGESIVIVPVGGHGLSQPKRRLNC